MEIVYLAQYNECIYTSSFELLSIHETKKGAYFAIKKSKLKVYNEHMKESKIHRTTSKYNEDRKWRIRIENVVK